MRDRLIFAVMKAAGHGYGGNLDQALPQAAQDWAKQAGERLIGTFPTASVLEDMAALLVDHKLRYDADGLGLAEAASEAARALGRLGRGKHKTITEADRERRREQARGLAAIRAAKRAAANNERATQ